MPVRRALGTMFQPVDLERSAQCAYGQSWSLNDESDAMWRIYSPNREGMMIRTTASSFSMITGIICAFLGNVRYYGEHDLTTLLEGFSQEQRLDLTFLYSAFLKRKAFEHECEARLILGNDNTCIQRTCDSKNRFLVLGLDSLDFIKGITIDPRADESHVDAMKSLLREIRLLNCA